MGVGCVSLALVVSNLNSLGPSNKRKIVIVDRNRKSPSSSSSSTPPQDMPSFTVGGSFGTLCGGVTVKNSRKKSLNTGYGVCRLWHQHRTRFRTTLYVAQKSLTWEIKEGNAVMCCKVCWDMKLNGYCLPISIHAGSNHWHHCHFSSSLFLLPRESRLEFCLVTYMQLCLASHLPYPSIYLLIQKYLKVSTGIGPQVK